MCRFLRGLALLVQGDLESAAGRLEVRVGEGGSEHRRVAEREHYRARESDTGMEGQVGSHFLYRRIREEVQRRKRDVEINRVAVRSHRR